MSCGVAPVARAWAVVTRPHCEAAISARSSMTLIPPPMNTAIIVARATFAVTRVKYVGAGISVVMVNDTDCEQESLCATHVSA